MNLQKYSVSLKEFLFVSCIWMCLKSNKKKIDTISFENSNLWRECEKIRVLHVCAITANSYVFLITALAFQMVRLYMCVNFKITSKTHKVSDGVKRALHLKLKNAENKQMSIEFKASQCCSIFDDRLPLSNARTHRLENSMHVECCVCLPRSNLQMHVPLSIRSSIHFAGFVGNFVAIATKAKHFNWNTTCFYFIQFEIITFITTAKNHYNVHFHRYLLFKYTARATRTSTGQSKMREKSEKKKRSQ